MARVYTRERLTAAVRGSHTLNEALIRLGRRPTDGSRAYARKLLRDWGIDASHLREAGVRHTEGRLRAAVQESRTTAEVVRRLGLSPVGGNHAHIARRIAAFGIDTAHFQTPPRRARDPHRVLLSLGSSTHRRVPGSRLRPELIRLGRPERCAECGIGPEWNGHPLRLEIDHINGDWWDNRPHNLRMLCPNCHAATDTYRGRKRGPRMPDGSR